MSITTEWRGARHGAGLPPFGPQPDDLLARIHVALAMAEVAVDQLLDEPDRGDLEPLETSADKVAAETAILLLTVLRLPPGRADDARRRASAIARRLVDHARGPRVRVAIALRPALALDFGVAHLALRAAGFPNADLDRAVSRALADPLTSARERPPHRDLEQRWLRSLLDDQAPPASALRPTALASGLDVLTGSRDDGYAFTHALMYATDFGVRRPWLPRPATVLAADAASAAAAALDQDDFDLTGELLLTWPFLTLDLDPTAAFAFAVLRSVEDEVGILPSLAVDTGRLAAMDATDEKRYVTATTYHTAYVMGLLCVAAFGARSDVGPNGPPADPRAVDALLDLVDASPRQPQWRRSFESLDATDRASLARFLVDVCLTRAIRAIDFAQVQQVLRVVTDLGIAPTTGARQACALLRRVADDLTPRHPASAETSAG